MIRTSVIFLTWVDSSWLHVSESVRHDWLNLDDEWRFQLRNAATWYLFIITYKFITGTPVQIYRSLLDLLKCSSCHLAVFTTLHIHRYGLFTTFTLKLSQYDDCYVGKRRWSQRRGRYTLHWHSWHVPYIRLFHTCLKLINIACLFESIGLLRNLCALVF